jgi:circadian clock protein KaiC
MPARSTGVAGLDKLIGGGVREGQMVLLLAPPGSGKTVLCHEFIETGLEKGEAVLYLASNESHDSFTKALQGGKADCSKLYFIDLYSWRQPGELPAQSAKSIALDSISNLSDVAQAVSNITKSAGRFDRIVLDSLSDLAMYAEPASLYKLVQLLKGQATKSNASSLVTLEYGLHDEKLNTTVNFLCDGMIEMRTEQTRQLRVTRMSGQTHSLDWADYTISEGPKIELKGVA